jgi:hypothetical protein
MKYDNGFAILLLLFLFLCGQPQAYAAEAKLEIRVDPRIELLAVMQSLTTWSNSKGFTNLDFQYYRDVKKHFGPYKNHRAVRWLQDNLNKGGWGGWNYDAPPRAMLHLSNLPDMKVSIPFSQYLLSRGNGEKNLNSMVDLFNDFARISNFAKFWSDHQPFYEEFLKRIRRVVPFDDYAKLMIDYYGHTPPKFVFIAAPLFTGGGFAADVDETAYYFGGPQMLDNGFPAYSEAHLRSLIFHEFGHSFITWATADFRSQIDQHQELFAYMKPAMLAQSYGSWSVAVDEHLVRTGQIVLARLAGFPEQADADMNGQVRLGFVLLPFLVERMEIYLKNRDKYPSFQSFVPELIRIFDEVKPVKSKKPGLMGFTFLYGEGQCRVNTLSDGPFKKVGLKKDDLILNVNGKDMIKDNCYKMLLSPWEAARTGDKVHVLVSGNGRQRELTVEVPFVEYYRFEKK